MLAAVALVAGSFMKSIVIIEIIIFSPVYSYLMHTIEVSASHSLAKILPEVPHKTRNKRTAS